MKRILQEAIDQGIGASLESFSIEQIPVELLPEHQPLGYQSAIALKLSAHSDRTPLDLAQQLLEFLSVQENLSGFSLSVRSPGWIQFHYGDRALAEQLQAFLLTPLLIPPTPLKKGGQPHKVPLKKGDLGGSNLPHNTQNYSKTDRPPSLDPDAPEVFTWQAAHARCCAILRLAQHQGLMRLDESTLRIIEPDHIPWLDDGHFLLSHPSEHSLIRSLLDIWDTLNDDPASPRLSSFSEKLSQDILRCDRQCRIWGATLRENRPLSMSRLGLVAIAGTTIKTLLEQGLNLIAPPEL